MFLPHRSVSSLFSCIEHNWSSLPHRTRNINSFIRVKFHSMTYTGVTKTTKANNLRDRLCIFTDFVRGDGNVSRMFFLARLDADSIDRTIVVSSSSSDSCRIYHP